MRRTALALLLALTALPLFAITGTPVRGNRVGVLRIADHWDGPEADVAATVQASLRDELRAAGFDAYDANATFDDLRRFDDGAPAYYVEVVSGRASGHEAGDIGLTNGVVGGSFGLVVSKVAAEVRLYDGKSLEMIRRFDVRHRSTRIAPTGVGIGGPWSWLFVALPIRHGYSGAAREVAHDAAQQISGAIRQ